MNIVITGAAGYLGSYLCRYLQNRNYTIYAFDNLFYKQKYTAELLQLIPNVHFYEEDVLDWSDNLKDKISSASYIIPLAAIVGAPACDKIPEYSYKINYGWFEDLLSHVNGFQTIIYPNTNSGYGTTPANTFCTEETPSNPVSLYGKLKQDTEDLLLDQYDNTIAYRLATVFGLSLRNRLDLLVNNFVFKALRETELTIYNGHVRRNFIHISDIARAFEFAMLNSGAMRGNVYNLGTDKLNDTKLGFAKTVGDILHCPVREVVGQEDPDKRDYLVSNAKLYSLGYAPTVNNMEKAIIELAQNIYNISEEELESAFNY